MGSARRPRGAGVVPIAWQGNVEVAPGHRKLGGTPDRDQAVHATLCNRVAPSGLAGYAAQATGQLLPRYQTTSLAWHLGPVAQHWVWRVLGLLLRIGAYRQRSSVHAGIVATLRAVGQVVVASSTAFQGQRAEAIGFVLWLMVSCALLCKIAACPATTWPPVGSWVAAGGLGGAANTPCG